MDPPGKNIHWKHLHEEANFRGKQFHKLLFCLTCTYKNVLYCVCLSKCDWIKKLTSNLSEFYLDIFLDIQIKHPAILLIERSSHAARPSSINGLHSTSNEFGRRLNKSTPLERQKPQKSERGPKPLFHKRNSKWALGNIHRYVQIWLGLLVKKQKSTFFSSTHSFCLSLLKVGSIECVCSLTNCQTHCKLKWIIKNDKFFYQIFYQQNNPYG